MYKIQALADNLVKAHCPPASLSSSVQKAVSSFDTISYSRQTKVPMGKSRRLAEREMKQRTTTKAVSPKISCQVDVPLFDIKQALKAFPGFKWNKLSPSFPLDSCKLHHYIAKDVMYADAAIHERLLILVSVEDVLFLTTWLPIYLAQALSAQKLHQGHQLYWIRRCFPN